MIQLKNVSKYYNNNGNVSLGLRNINLNLNKGEIVAIVGESGSGKSTLLNVICGVDNYEEGEIFFNGNETSYFNQEDMDTFRRTNVSFIYQTYNIIDSYTVLENVMLPLLINGMNKKEAKKRALELIEKVGLSKRIKHRGTKLSGGEKQRCVIARALASDCPILACDEPTGNLDSKTGDEIIKLIKEVASDKLVLIVTHNYEQVKDIVTRTITLGDGEIINDTNPNNDYVIEQEKEVEENNQKISRKVLFLLSTLNIKNTPRKNLFILIVLTTFCFIGFFLYLLCYYSSYQAQFNSYSGFSYNLKDRIIVYDKDHNEIDMSKFEGYEAYPNAFYEDIKRDVSSSNHIFNSVISTHMPNNVTNVEGKKIVDGNNVFLIASKYASKDQLDDMMEQTFSCNSDYKFKISGYGFCDDVDGYALIVSKEALKYIYYPISNVAVYASNNEKIDVIYSPNSTKNELTLTQNYNIDRIEIYLKNYKFDLKDFDILVDESATSNRLTIANDYVNNNTYEITIYTNDYKGIERICNANNYSYIYPAKAGSQMISLSFIGFITEAVFSSILMLILVFVSFVVLSRVYQSKKNDYAIMRSLGLYKTQMGKIVNYEVLMLGIISSILAVIIYLICTTFNYEFAQYLKITNPIFFIFYFLVMPIFMLMLAHRFNKKLFKFSINKTIKEVF